MKYQLKVYGCFPTATEMELVEFIDGFENKEDVHKYVQEKWPNGVSYDIARDLDVYYRRKFVGTRFEVMATQNVQSARNYHRMAFIHTLKESLSMRERMDFDDYLRNKNKGDECPF